MTTYSAPLQPGSQQDDERPSTVWARRFAQEDLQWSDPPEDDDGYMEWSGAGGYVWLANPPDDDEEADTPSDRLPPRRYSAVDYLRRSI